MLLLSAVLFLSPIWAKPSEAEQRAFYERVRGRSCADIAGWQRDLEELIEKKFLFHLFSDPAEKCEKSWTSDQVACLSNIKKFYSVRDEFFYAGERQVKFFGEDEWERLNDLCDVFECKPMKRSDGSELQIVHPFKGWPHTFLNCIRDSDSASKDPRCAPVKNWCAVEMKRHHQGVISDEKIIFFYDPVRNRFILNGGSAMGNREDTIEMLTVVKPKSNGEPWRGVFSSSYGGIAVSPNNHGPSQGCWHCHPAGAPRKMSPLWGSVSQQDRKGLNCINQAIGNMGDFSTDHLWSNNGWGPHRGNGTRGQSCHDCHSGDWKDSIAYRQRGRLLPIQTVTQELFAKMTSWNPTMPPGLARKIPGFDKAMQTLEKIYDLEDSKRKEISEAYIADYWRQLSQRGLNKEDGRNPEAHRQKTEKMLEAHRAALLGALKKVPGVSAAEHRQVAKVLAEVDRQGLADFMSMIQADNRRLALHLRGGREKCLLTAPPAPVNPSSSTIK
ncbi:MAG: hypothetical protein AB7F86_13205 [Bdellovibrionales bacterium]